MRFCRQPILEFRLVAESRIQYEVRIYNAAGVRLMRNHGYQAPVITGVAAARAGVQLAYADR
nr:hypothetical protein [uncultured Rhodopila sp.]